MGITVREARESDVYDLHEVMLEISDNGIKDKELGKKMITEIAADKRQCMLVAVDEGLNKVVGSAYGIVFPDICEDGRPILLIENVAVLKSCQGMGVGRKIMEAIENFGHSHDVHYEMLVSGLERVGAHGFYKAIGYEEKKAFKKYFEEI